MLFLSRFPPPLFGVSERDREGTPLCVKAGSERKKGNETGLVEERERNRSEVFLFFEGFFCCFFVCTGGGEKTKRKSRYGISHDLEGIEGVRSGSRAPFFSSAVETVLEEKRRVPPPPNKSPRATGKKSGGGGVFYQNEKKVSL